MFTIRSLRRALPICLVVSALACSGADGGVPWNDYASSLKSTIDSLADAGDCSGLQSQFDAADANNDATMSRTGHNNAELMKYIDGKLRAADCY